MNESTKKIFAPIGWCIISIIIISTSLFLFILIFKPTIGIDNFHGTRPYNYPYTIWASENPDISFIIYQPHDEIYGQITIGDTSTDLRISFDYGARIYFHDISSRNPETGEFHYATWLFQGNCRFGEESLVVTITDNKKGFLDNSIKRITFIRTDMNEE
jgi:hypothetical protein